MHYDVILIGSGMGSLTSAALLAKKGYNVLIIEHNWIPGGCTTSYWRKGFVFEAGATTLVGMDRGMPLRHLLDSTGIQIPMRKLDLPMQVHMPGKDMINKFQDIDDWISEAKKHFDGKQEKFWRQSYDISRFVWDASLKYLNFPPRRVNDFMKLARGFSLNDAIEARHSLISTEKIIRKHRLIEPDFRKFINEQLMITAQNTMEEVNYLFGAASLCYTNYTNYYIDGGLINLVRPIVNYIEKNNGKIIYRKAVQNVNRKRGLYEVHTKDEVYKSKFVISGIPVNNTRSLFNGRVSTKANLMDSKKLNSAFQMGIGFKPSRKFASIHHQIHLEKPLIGTGSGSIFVSLNHPEDTSRSDLKDYQVASVSTHLPDPENTVFDKERVEKEIVEVLEKSGFLKKENIAYAHSSTSYSWKKWTKRKWGFVGGYPQFMKIKPWLMNEARLDDQGAYQVGDTVYPGQGIPGTTLSGIIAAEKLMDDTK